MQETSSYHLHLQKRFPVISPVSRCFCYQAMLNASSLQPAAIFGTKPSLIRIPVSCVRFYKKKNREKNVPAKTYKNLNNWPHIIIPSLELCPSWYFSSVSYSLVLSLFSKTKVLAETERLQTEHSQLLNFPQTSWFTPLCKLVSRNRYFVKSCGGRYRQHARCASRRFKNN